MTGQLNAINTAIGTRIMQSSTAKTFAIWTDKIRMICFFKLPTLFIPRRDAKFSLCALPHAKVHSSPVKR